MAITTDETTELTTTATVSIRVPTGTGTKLIPEAETRLSRADGVREVRVTTLRELAPNLSATVITVDVAVRSTTAGSGEGLHARLADVPGVETTTITGQE